MATKICQEVPTWVGLKSTLFLSTLILTLLEASYHKIRLNKILEGEFDIGFHFEVGTSVVKGLGDGSFVLELFESFLSTFRRFQTKKKALNFDF